MARELRVEEHGMKTPGQIARGVLDEWSVRWPKANAAIAPYECWIDLVYTTADRITQARAQGEVAERERIAQRMEDWAACLGVSRLDEDLVGAVYLENFAATLRTDFEENKA